MQKDTSIVLAEHIGQRILLIRGHKVMLDNDLAALYGVPTKRINEQVKRNVERFPDDFMFQLTSAEIADARAQIAHAWNRSQIATGSQKHRDPRFRPFAFTEHGAIMAANVVNSRRAIEASVYVVRAFIRLREVTAAHKELAQRVTQLESRMTAQDVTTRQIVEAIQRLAALPPGPMPEKRRIGFHVREAGVRYKRRAQRTGNKG